jgi:hypothetical protein
LVPFLVGFNGKTLCAQARRFAPFIVPKFTPTAQQAELQHPFGRA